MIQFFPGEQWKEIKIDAPLSFRHAVSSFGRLIRFVNKMEEGRLLHRIAGGYKILRYEIKVGEKKITKMLLVRKLVAEYFLPPKQNDQNHILCLDHNRNNNHVNNLRWATRQEMLEHHEKSPFVIESKKKLKEKNLNSDRYKLNHNKVILLKRKLFDPNQKTKIKLLAKQFGIGRTQLYRIRKGKCWGHVTYENTNN